MLNSDYKSNKLNPTLHHGKCCFLQINVKRYVNTR